MNYLNLDIIKQQLIIDSSFTDDDVYLEHLADVAEEIVADEIDEPLPLVVAKNDGQLPKPLLHAMLLIVDYYYGLQRGSNAQDAPVPQAFIRLCRLYRKYN